jgi:hypothetical protein
VPVNVRFVVEKLALVQVFLRVLRYSPVSIIAPVLYFRLHFNTSLITKTRNQGLRMFKQRNVLSDIEKKK